MHGATIFAAKIALAINRIRGRKKGVVLDFGCGVGRVVRFFGSKGWSVIGTEVTMEMLSAAHKFGLPQAALVALTDGVNIPVRDQSVDMIWVCGVLKYGLFKPGSACRIIGNPVDDEPSTEPFVPVYRDIAKEMYRVLKPGGFIVDVEMWVDAPPDVFIPDFEEAGFVTKQVRILRRYAGKLERKCQDWRNWRRLPPKLVTTAGQLCAAFRFWFDNPRSEVCDLNFRDYLFIWSKPQA
ncbi:MAG: class I SAM-dependent methyltransferase [Pyrinomonadaceae bacterium]|nr:class I SAM-dependent methyltransferase [Pyrinomonadaceae bacterium]